MPTVIKVHQTVVDMPKITNDDANELHQKEWNVFLEPLKTLNRYIGANDFSFL